MTVIRVNPSSVVAYGSDAQEKFNSIRTELEKLVTACAEVHYYGPNAVQFKTTCGQMAADLAKQLVEKMGQIATAVQTATSNIAASLGGVKITISVNGSAVAVPAVPSVDYVDIDTSALQGLVPTVTGMCTTINGLFDQHLAKLGGTDWEGNAKEQAVAAARGFTSAAKTAVGDAQQKITTYINSQIESVTGADNA